ncbi:hypothetical protein [Chryseobacterium gregarium]|uniref:hypothetical protein n=1 Tax=Chryseobacterium gregarium TaxID=456299 RepID=UPI0003FA87A3|nr:hypothetical protein [Chryseobacterium gregarium]
MKVKHLLVGISLLSILTACSDRLDEYSNPSDKNKVDINVNKSKDFIIDQDSVKTDSFKKEISNLKTNKTETSKTQQDSLQSKEIINETNTQTNPGTGADGETIDPTKSDRPK